MNVKTTFLFLFLFLCGLMVDGQRGNGGGRRNDKINDGHRLITKALWRIFDALMEKKNHEELYGRMKYVENTLDDVTAKDARMESKVNSIMSSLNSYKEEISSMKKEIEKIRSLEGKIRSVEERQLRMERPRDDSMVHSSGPVQTKSLYGSPISSFGQPEAAFSSCPPPFEGVGRDCIYVHVQHKLGWKAARSECSQIGGDLAAPSDLQIFREYLGDLPREGRPEYIWMGASKTQDGLWIWSTGDQAGRPVDMSQKTWNEDLPEGVGDCLGLYERAGYRAYDYTCEEEDFFVCQYFL